MSKKIETNQKHMNQDNRVVIEKRLDASVSFRAIGTELGKDPTTIAKEVKKHRVFQMHNTFTISPLDVLMPKTATESMYVHQCLSVSENVNGVINVTAIVKTISPMIITAL